MIPPISERSHAVVEAAARARLRPWTRLSYWLARRWMLAFSILYGLLVGLPFLAPVFMQIGWEGPGRAIYFLYTVLCHQLPQRSFFLFGPRAMYDLPTIQAAWQDTFNPLILRQFIGNPAMGWKVAWSDRMVSMYTSILLFGWLWYPFRKRLKAFPLWALVLLAFPMFVDGSTHFISDFAGIGQGFRDSNAWLGNLTNHAFSPSFYTGDAPGSFNSWMRLITGVLFGAGVVGYVFPVLEDIARQTARLVKVKYREAGLPSRS